MLHRASRGEKAFNATNLIIMATLAFICIYPFWYVIVLSFNDVRDTVKGGLFFWPRVFDLRSYQALFMKGDIFLAYAITITRVSVVVPLGLLLQGAAAYAISRRELKGRHLMILYFLLPMLFGAGLIPYYMVLRMLHLLDSFWIFIIPSLVGVGNLIIMKTFFQGLPEGLVEAAMIDGADHINIYLRLVIPLSLPMFAALGVFYAVGLWNDWATGAFFVSSPRLWPLQTYVQGLVQQTGVLTLILQFSSERAPETFKEGGRALAGNLVITEASLRNAAVVASTLPIILIYPWLQKYFVKGVLIGSIKE